MRGVENETVVDRLIDVADKNSYSMYALPAVLLAGYIALRFDWKRVAFKRWVWLPLMACSVAAAYAILAGSNRSGYLGLAFIIGELLVYSLLNRRLKIIGTATAWILVASVATLAVGLLVAEQATESFERRYEQTVEGTQSDRLRWDIFVTSMKIGMDNPIVGKSPQGLPYEIGKRLYSKYNSEIFETHNVFAHLIGGCGLPCTAAFFALAGTLWFWRPKVRTGMQLGAGFYDARNFLRMMLCLWAIARDVHARNPLQPGILHRHRLGDRIMHRRGARLRSSRFRFNPARAACRGKCSNRCSRSHDG